MEGSFRVTNTWRGCDCRLAVPLTHFTNTKSASRAESVLRMNLKIMRSSCCMQKRHLTYHVLRVRERTHCMSVITSLTAAQIGLPFDVESSYAIT
ncbi:hypothetical protein BaRGS_00008957 [Batillaria attramentaria]|uniref:Uncharacterized protein n=1 Tax=Batillaria attramentaria TaxID=370345 RepID=A0ABD0LKS9_9CAEN